MSSENHREFEYLNQPIGRVSLIRILIGLVEVYFPEEHRKEVFQEEIKLK
jgi:hypothetical protein